MGGLVAIFTGLSGFALELTAISGKWPSWFLWADLAYMLVVSAALILCAFAY